jgi:hypothetical protein
LNLLLTDPSAFLNVLSGGDVNAIPQKTINDAATKPVTDNLPKIPTWAKIAIIGGVAAVGLVAISVTAYTFRK